MTTPLLLAVTGMPGAGSALDGELIELDTTGPVDVHGLAERLAATIPSP